GADETDLVGLITRRSRVQIPPPPPIEIAGQGRFPTRGPAFLRGRLVKDLSPPAALTGVEEHGCQTAVAAISWALVCRCGRWLPTWRAEPGSLANSSGRQPEEGAR